MVNMQADKYINQSACCWAAWPGKKKKENNEGGEKSMHLKQIL